MAYFSNLNVLNLDVLKVIVLILIKESRPKKSLSNNIFDWGSPSTDLPLPVSECPT